MPASMPMIAADVVLVCLIFFVFPETAECPAAAPVSILMIAANVVLVRLIFFVFPETAE